MYFKLLSQGGRLTKTDQNSILYSCERKMLASQYSIRARHVHSSAPRPQRARASTKFAFLVGEAAVSLPTTGATSAGAPTVQEAGMTSDDSDGSHGLGDNPQGRTLLVVVNPLAPLDNSNNSRQGEADHSNTPQPQHAVMLQDDSSPHDANACGQQPAPTSPPAALDVEAGQGLCWICLDEDADGEVTKPCSCPDRWSHPLCLARW